MSLSLLSDIGGTHARFGLWDDTAQTLTAFDQVMVASFDSFADAAGHFLNAHHDPDLSGVAVAAAGPVVEGGIDLTNSHWRLSRTDLGRFAARTVLMNDFAALALCLPALKDGDCRILGPDMAGEDHGTLGVLGPGTGLGVAGLVPSRDGLSERLITGEGGHVTLAAQTRREWDLIAALHDRFSHVSVERLVSGPGFGLIYETLARIDGAPLTALDDPADIAAKARAGEPRALEAVALFAQFLGAAAGDLALSLGATGGIYIAGGVVPRWGDLFPADLFRARFEQKGRFTGWLARVPTRLIIHDRPAFVGLARALRD